jgi:hypothetical protein
MEVVEVKRISRMLLFGSGVLVLSLTAHGQSRDPHYSQRDDPYRNGRNGAGYDDGRYSQQRGYPDQGRYGNGYGQGSLVGRVLSDLDRAARNAYLDGHERKHFDEAARKLQEFEERWAQGRFDNGKLDKAIENLDHLANADRVSGRDREMLARDVQDLRQFRSTGGRYSNGYGDYRDDRYNRRYNPRSR